MMDQPSSEPLQLSATTTRDAARRTMMRAFAGLGVDTPDLDARLLLCGVLQIEATELILRPDAMLGSSYQAVQSAASRRLNFEPVSRILGRRAFYGRDLEISPAVLDPRPDSETLIEAALAAVIAEGWEQRSIRILDIGTGSGCLLVTLLAELPKAVGLGTDVSSAALELARRNAARHGVDDRAEWKIADALAGIDGRFDLIVANPPYIPTTAIAGLPRDVRDHDPHAALDGGSDGLDIYRAVVERITDVLPEGYAIFEVGPGQAGAVIRLLKGLEHYGRWPDPVISCDLGGSVRCVAQRTLR